LNGSEYEEDLFAGDRYFIRKYIEVYSNKSLENLLKPLFGTKRNTLVYKIFSLNIS
jgi:hypothetical protein